MELQFHKDEIFATFLFLALNKAFKLVSVSGGEWIWLPKVDIGWTRGLLEPETSYEN